MKLFLAVTVACLVSFSIAADDVLSQNIGFGNMNSSGVVGNDNDWSNNTVGKHNEETGNTVGYGNTNTHNVVGHGTSEVENAVGYNGYVVGGEQPEWGD